MDERFPIYNSRLTKAYVEYARVHYPGLDIDELLKYAGITRYALEDPAHWFSQRQVDRFHEILVKRTGNPGISREVGRYAASAEALGIMRQYVLGFLNPGAAYRVTENFSSRLTRGHTYKTRRISKNKVEVTVFQKPGVKEKPFQCENRLGMLESLAKLFTNKHAEIEHPSCFHKGADEGQYIISWENTPSLTWKRIRNYVLLLSSAASFALLFSLPFIYWLVLLLVFALFNATIYSYTEYVQKVELSKAIEGQGNVAKALLDEMTIRYNNAMLVQEIGKATSTMRDVGKLTETVAHAVEKRLDFDRGMIMLANEKKTRLVHAAGFGYTREQEALLMKTEFRLDNPLSKGIFVVSFLEQKPFLISDISEDFEKLSERSLEFAKKMGAKSLICVPIVYESESLGILVVDNIKSKRMLTQSDMGLLMGVASQTAVSIINAQSFKRLQKSEERFKSLSEVTLEAIVFHDKGILLDANSAFSAMFGYEHHELVGTDIIETLISPLFRDVVRKYVTSGYEKAYEVLAIRKDGSKFPIEVEARPSTYKGQLLHVASIRDLTERKAAEEERKKLQIQLQQAQKMEAIGMLAGGVAHDLNNILAGIVSYPELLLMDLPADSPLKKPILTIKKSGEKAATIVQDLLTLARRGVSTREAVQLNELIKEYLRSPEYEKLIVYNENVEVELNLEDTLMNMMGSPVHLSKVLMNLISNAAEAMPHGGKISISTQNRYLDRQLRGYEPVPEGDYICLTVSDTGIGIPLADLQRIFEPFYTKKVMGRSGTGLGMAVVWGTVKDHKGYIDIRSVEGKGATFSLYFPVTRKRLVKETASLSMEEYKGHEEAILIVDDVEEQRNVALGMLKKLGYAVTAVSSGEAAVEYMKKNSADLLVLDMIMDPGIDGLDTYKRILELHPEQKAIIASGFSETERVKEAQKLGAGPYVRKPYSIEKIGLAVRDALNR